MLILCVNIKINDNLKMKILNSSCNPCLLGLLDARYFYKIRKLPENQKINISEFDFKISVPRKLYGFRYPIISV